MMRVALQAQQAVDHLVPQRAGSDALDEKIYAGRYLEAGVPKNGSDHGVGQHLGSERSQRDGRLSLRLLQSGVDLRGSFLDVVHQRRQIGVENACGSGTDGHDGLLATTFTQCMVGMDAVNDIGCQAGHLAVVSGDAPYRQRDPYCHSGSLPRAQPHHPRRRPLVQLNDVGPRAQEVAE